MKADFSAASVETKRKCKVKKKIVVNLDICRKKHSKMDTKFIYGGEFTMSTSTLIEILNISL